MGGPRVAGRSRGDRIAPPRDRATDPPLRAHAQARQSGGSGDDRDSRVRRAALVAAPPAQPDGAALEGAAPVRAVDRGHERALGAREDVVSISSRLTYVQAQDLLEEELPTTRV